MTHSGAPLHRVCAALLALLLPALTLALAGQVAAAGTPAVAATPALQVPPVALAERTLPNGLQFIAVPNRASPTVSVQVWYHVGAKDDPAGRSGFAHLFEHLMFKRTRYLRAEQFDRLTEDVGGANNAFTSDDVTAFQDIVPSNHLEALLWAEAERMANLDVVQASFESERSVVKEEYRERVLTPPYGRFTNAIASLPYESHPYRRPVIGRIEDLEAATLADVAAFHATYYRPDNATLVSRATSTRYSSTPGSTSISHRCRARPRRCRASRPPSLPGRMTAASPSPARAWPCPPWQWPGWRRRGRAPMRPRCASPQPCSAVANRRA